MKDTSGTKRPRQKLSRERVLAAALRLADEEGIDAVSMRRLGQALGVEAMSLYKHVAGKEDILDGISDLVMEEVEVPSRDLPWRAAVRQSAISTHRALLRHPWASAVLESRRNPGPTRLRYLDAVVSILLDAGFTLRNTTALLFVNSVSGAHNMVYRREDGTIGWVEPRADVATRPREAAIAE